MEMKSTNFVNISGYYDPQAKQYHFWFDYEEVVFNEQDFHDFANMIADARFWSKPAS